MKTLINMILTPETFLGVGILLQITNNLSSNDSSSWTKKYIPGGVLESYFIQTFTILLITFLLILSDLNFDDVSSSLLFSSSSWHNNAIKALIIFFSILALPAITLGIILERIVAFEFYTFFLFSVLSSLLMVSVSDFLSFFLLLEMQALCFYVLAAFKKDSIFSIEAAIKYFLLNSTTSCILLFSLSLLYGFLGTLNFEHISVILLSFPFQEDLGFGDFLIIVCLLLLVLVIFFKLGAAPFHFWVPDVYEGAPVSSTLIFSFLPKLVFFDLFIKFNFVFGEAFNSLYLFFIIFGILTVFIGSCCALYQEKLKRFLIYSSISQVGFPIALLGLGVHSPAVQAAIYFFILVYTMTSILTWSFYIILYQYSDKVDQDSSSVEKDFSFIYLSDLSKLFSDTHVVFIACFIIFSLCGIPPFFGFLIKFIVVREFILNSYSLSAVILIFLSAISVFFYLRLLKVIALDKQEKKRNFSFIFSPATSNAKFFYLTCFVLCFILCLLSTVFLSLDSWLYASQFLFFTN